MAHACAEHSVSQRRACLILQVDRSSVRYQSIRPDDTALREAMKTVAAERRRFGYRRIHIMLGRQGIVMNQKKLRRLYCEERLQVRKRGGRKRALGTRRPMILPDRPNERWSLDFVSDAFTDGRRFRVLAVVDDHTRECLALVADPSLSGRRVCRELDAVIARRGRPQTIVSDNGTPSSPALPFSDGARTPASAGTTSRRANRCRMALSKALTAASGTSASTKRCSRHSRRHEPGSNHGRRITTSIDRIPHWNT